MNKRQIQKENMIKAIEDAANRCFIRKGMSNTLITDICEEANVSVGAFYHYFKNKDDLIIHRFRHFDMKFLEVADALIENKNALQSLVDFSLFFSKDSWNEQLRSLNLEYLKSRTTLSVEQLYPKNRPYYLILCTIIANGQKRKQLRTDMYPWEIADLVMATTRGYNLDWASYNGNYSLKERLERDMPIIFNGLKYLEGMHVVCYDCALPIQNVPFLYQDEVNKLREYCLNHLI